MSLHELCYHIIRNSLCENFYYNNYNLALSTALNHISCKTTDLLVSITPTDGGPSSLGGGDSAICHRSRFAHHSPPCTPVGLLGRGSVLTAETPFRRVNGSLSPEDLWENCFPPSFGFPFRSTKQGPIGMEDTGAEGPSLGYLQADR